MHISRQVWPMRFSIICTTKHVLFPLLRNMRKRTQHHDSWSANGISCLMMSRWCFAFLVFHTPIWKYGALSRKPVIKRKGNRQTEGNVWYRICVYLQAILYPWNNTREHRETCLPLYIKSFSCSCNICSLIRYWILQGSHICHFNRIYVSFSFFIELLHSWGCTLPRFVLRIESKALAQISNLAQPWTGNSLPWEMQGWRCPRN